MENFINCAYYLDADNKGINYYKHFYLYTKPFGTDYPDETTSTSNLLIFQIDMNYKSICLHNLFKACRVERFPRTDTKCNKVGPSVQLINEKCAQCIMGWFVLLQGENCCTAALAVRENVDEESIICSKFFLSNFVTPFSTPKIVANQ